jgi:hypothetical protein
MKTPNKFTVILTFILMVLAFNAGAGTLPSDSDSANRDNGPPSLDSTGKKSSGNKSSTSTSHDRASEKRVDQSKTNKESADKKAGKDFSQRIDVNTLLINRFIQYYEMDQPDSPQTQIFSNLKPYFHACKPFINARAAFPVLISRSPVSGLDNTGGSLSQLSEKNQYSTVNLKQFPQTMSSSSKDAPVIRSYAQCRIYASYWLSEAGKRLALTEVVFPNEDKVADKIDLIFSEMDDDKRLQSQIVDKGNKVWGAAECTGNNYSDGTSGLSFNCGTFSADVNGSPSFSVLGRETLSGKGIAGVVYSVSISAGESRSNSAESSHTTASSESESIRGSQSTDSYNDLSQQADVILRSKNRK